VSRLQAIQPIVGRELLTVFRSRVYVGLVAGITLVSFGMLFAGGGSEIGYVPAAIDLLTPMELLVPVVAVALGYRTITDDAQSGELEVLGTYPVSAWTYVVGVYVGRALALAVALAVPLALVGFYLSTQSPADPPTLATHTGIDSPVLFVRFVALTIGYGLVTLAFALAASAIAWSRRTAIALVILLFGLVVVGIDIVLLRGFGVGWVGENQLTTALAASPASAYRGLVLETVLYVAFDRDSGYAAPIASVLGLVAWLFLSLAVTTIAVRREHA
jgi:ABC-type transport system involved in multi-copper enzyme maturation permease subunit